MKTHGNTVRKYQLDPDLMSITLRLLSEGNRGRAMPLVFAPFTNAPVTTSPPSEPPRYRRCDVHLSSIKPDQRKLWEAHYPIGTCLPYIGAGLTLKELQERVMWYCKHWRLDYVGGVEDAVEELIAEGLVTND